MDDKRKIAQALEQLALLAELSGENAFKVRAFANAARTVQKVTGDLAEIASRGELTAIPGIGKGIAAIIGDILATGSSQELERFSRSVPTGLPELAALPGLGPKRIRVLWQELDVTSLGELEYACRENRLTTLAGFGAATQSKLLAAVEFRRRAASMQHISDADALGDMLATALAGAARDVAVAGEVRRRCEVVREITLVCAGASLPAVQERLGRLLDHVEPHGDREVRGAHAGGVPVRVGCPPAQYVGSALAWYTGSDAHFAELAQRTRDAGLRFEDGLLLNASGGAIACADEQEFYSRLGLAWIPPELREGTGEIEAAASGTLPALVEERDILGAVHVHTTDSDGTASLDAMAAGAVSKGWEFLGIADHSAYARYANGLDAARLRAQGEAITARNARGASPLLLRGTEADVLPDGTLDLPADVQLDFAVASVHSSFTLSEDAQTARLVRSISRGRGTILGHPTGRLLLARDGYRVDLEAVLQAAARTGAAIEINAHPFRLDLDWRWVRRAVALGIPLSIGPDAHDVGGLGVVRYGVAVARKGWATKRDILNAHPWPWWH